jgi:hypothetical protein
VFCYKVHHVIVSGAGCAEHIMRESVDARISHECVSRGFERLCTHPGHGKRSEGAYPSPDRYRGSHGAFTGGNALYTRMLDSSSRNLLFY